MSEATIHIVDDDQAVRGSLRMLVESAGLRALTYHSGRDFLERYEPSKPECLLLDLRMPGMNGLELQRELQNRGKRIATMFLSGHGDIPVAAQALREGALDFVEKPVKNEQLLERLRKSVDIDQRQERARLDKLQAEQRLGALTRRERQVVDLLVQGKINKIIAAELGLSIRTVESHRARAMKKVGAQSLSDIFKLVLAAEREDNAGRRYINTLNDP